MPNNKHQYKYPLVLIGLSICWVTLLNYLLQLHAQDSIYLDSTTYKDSADLLYHQFKFHYFRPMLMALITGVPYLLDLEDSHVYQFSIFINLSSWIGTSVILFQIIKEYLPAKKAFLFTCLYISLIGAIFSTFHLLSESIFTFLMILGLYFIHKYQKSNKYTQLAIALSIFLVSMLVRPGAKFLALLIILYYSKTIFQHIKHPANLILLGSFILISIQMIGIKKEYGDYTISYVDTAVLYNYIGTRAITLQEDTEYKQGQHPRTHYFDNLSYSEQKKAAFEDLKDQLQHNTLNFFKAYFINLFENTKSPSDCVNVCENKNNNSFFDFFQSAFIHITKWQNRIITLTGVILAFLFGYRSFKKDQLTFLTSFYILYIFLLSASSSSQGDRFHIVFYPFVLVLLSKWYLIKKT